MPTAKPAKKSPTKRAAKPSTNAVPRTKNAKGDLAPERVTEILKKLDEAYPNAVCALHHRTPWELLVATILSAQCTDVRVNMVTPELFKRFPTPAAMAKASIPELVELIRTTGFFNNKAKSIKGAAEAITNRFGGKVPETLDELITVPGAARKTANVVLGVSFGKAEGVVVDTHVFRIAHRLGLTRSSITGARFASHGTRSATSATSRRSATRRTRLGGRRVGGSVSQLAATSLRGPGDPRDSPSRDRRFGLSAGALTSAWCKRNLAPLRRPAAGSEAARHPIRRQAPGPVARLTASARPAGC